jgi:peptidoglycan-N-acetylglucosamine deacetylase
MIKTNRIIKLIYPGLVWHKKVDDRIIYLTFDDGPVPGVTEFVLEELEKFNAKATFFCVGENIVKHPELFNKIVSAGHQVGNHTFNHKNGWKTADPDYLGNIDLCEEALSAHLPANRVKLFRPPYGRIKKSQIMQLKDKFQIVMWDVLTKDYDHGKPEGKCLKKSIGSTVPGSIVVFHDRYKNEERLKFMLPRYLFHFAEAGYVFERMS